MNRMTINQWEVWFAEFPFEEDETKTKRRPVIVLGQVESEEVKVLSVKVTGHPEREEDPFDLPIKQWQEAGLREPSVARVSKTILLTLDKFKRKFGEVQEEDQVAIVETYMEYVNSQ
jgi:hypothetical protein